MFQTISGRMPTPFSSGDSFRSQKVEFADIKLGVLLYPKGTDSADGLSKAKFYLKNYSDRARIFDVTVSFGDKDKKSRHVIIPKRRCKMIAEFDAPEHEDDHSPLLIAALLLPG